MKYYVSNATLSAIKRGTPICDVYLPRHKTESRQIAIDISVIKVCDACDCEQVAELMSESDLGTFCEHCINSNKHQ